ncbi:unnamed protein product [Trichobilharzia szidati]|nr:unnamed protein product [Trichobilharzia szidati]
MIKIINNLQYSEISMHLMDITSSLNFMLLFLWIIILLPESVYTQDMSKIMIDEKTGYFMDSRGYVKLFHGINSVPKYPPHYFPSLLNASTLRAFRDWGINVIRLEFSWLALKPSEQNTNYEYLQIVRKIIDNAEENGIYVILDFHQDGLSERIGAIDSVPNWFMDKLPRPPKLFQYPWPLSIQPNNPLWFLTYFTYESAYTFGNIYKNVSGVWNDLGEFWRIAAENFGMKANLLGYNLINEPPPGNFYANPFLLMPYNSGHQLLALYDYLIKIIREKDENSLIFFDPITYAIYFPQVNGISGTGMHRLPGSLEDESAAKKTVLSYHYYCWLLQSQQPEEDVPSWKRFICDNVILPYVLNNVKNITKTTGGGRFLTEFGLCFPDDNPKSINTVEFNAVLNAADEHFESWTYWDDYNVFPRVTLYDTQLRSFSRAYPQSTAGQPIRLNFNVQTSEFYYTFMLTHKCKSNQKLLLIAEIYVPLQTHYPAGMNVTFIPNELYYVMNKANTNLMSVYAPCTLIRNNNNNNDNNNNDNNNDNNNNSDLQVEISITPFHSSSSNENSGNIISYSTLIQILLIIKCLLLASI